MIGVEDTRGLVPSSSPLLIKPLKVVFGPFGPKVYAR